MRKALFTLAVVVLCGTAHAQIAKKDWQLPAVDVKTLDGKTFSTGDIDNDGKPVIISFWATWCKPCVLELSTIAETYDEWQEETGVKLIAISIDDARNTSKVQPLVNGKDWDYEVYLDPNGDLKRAMNVNTVPHTFLLNGNKEVVYQHNSYAPGDEQHLYDKVKALLVK
jgi:cytochrome c biogenesis protein CcmG/thiol:disulfide interchange protein DsbE